MATLRKNFIYSTLLVCANYLFPLVVYPYVSRVLGVEEIGLVSFIDSIATYFILFSMMGISILGIREVASAAEDRARLGNVFRSLLVLNGLVTAVALAAMVAATLLVPQLREHAGLMGIGMCKLIFNMFLIEWFWRGLEEFRYITLRTIVIKLLYVTSVFIFVRDREDTGVYYFLTMTVVVANAVVNMAYASQFVSVRKGGISLRRYIAPFFKARVVHAVEFGLYHFQCRFSWICFRRHGGGILHYCLQTFRHIAHAHHVGNKRHDSAHDSACLRKRRP